MSEELTILKELKNVERIHYWYSSTGARKTESKEEFNNWNFFKLFVTCIGEERDIEVNANIICGKFQAKLEGEITNSIRSSIYVEHTITFDKPGTLVLSEVTQGEEKGVLKAYIWMRE